MCARTVPRGLVLLVCGLLASVADAAVCPVPSATHPTIGAAANDAACSTIALAAGTYPENVALDRDCLVSGAGSGTTTLAGAMLVSGTTTDVTVSGLRIDATVVGVAGCARDALWASGGARVVTGPDLLVVQTAAGSGRCRVFADGFESGGVLAWSAHQP